MGTHPAAAATNAPWGAQGRLWPDLGTKKRGATGTSSGHGEIPIFCPLPAKFFNLFQTSVSSSANWRY